MSRAEAHGGGDAGFTLLELLIVLGLSAMVLAMVAAGLRPRGPDAGSDLAKVTGFIDKARTEIALSGRAGVLVIGAGTIAFGTESLAWDPARLNLSAAGAAASDASTAQRVVLYPDGTASSGLVATDGSGAHALPAVLRASAGADAEP